MSIVHRWLDTEGKSIDKAFGKQPGPPPNAGSGSLPGNPQPGAEGDESEVLDESEGLRAALIEYQNLAIDPRLELDVDTCTWENVFECMTGAEEDYEQKAKSWRGVGRRLLRKAGDRAEDVNPWLELIPPEYGMGIIGAGISIMFMLARNASENREKILNAFEEIPIIVASAKAKLRAFPDNQELKSCNKKLSLEIVVSVSKLVGALLPEKHAKKVPYFWFRSKLGKSTIDDVLKSLRYQADALKRLVQDFVDEAIGEIQRATRDIKKDTSDLKETASNIHRNTADLKNYAFELKTTTSGIQRDTSTLISETSGIRVELTDLGDKLASDYQKRLQIYEREREISEKKKEEAEKSRNLMAQTLEEVVAESQRKAHENERLRAELEYMRARTPVSSLMTAEQFLAAIGASTLIHQSTEDIDKVLRLQGSIHPVAEAEAVSLLRTDEFRAWLQPARSDAILIDGAGAAVEFFDHAERVSAKSVLCASLLATLGRSQQETFQLFFFAGLHSSEKDPSSDGPRGMIRSLLCELVKEAHRRGWLYLDFIDDKTYRDGIQSQNIHYLCDAFYRILQRLQMRDAVDLSVYCVVDGIALYEQQRWYRDLEVVTNMFRVIVNDTKLKPAFKLLLTGPHRVRYVYEWLGLLPSKRLSTNAVIAGENLATPFGLYSGVEQALQARRLQNLADRRGRSLYFDDMEMAEDDYE
ncbi:hypothetical protein GGS23DRAFT_565261 [Durotheca rogersii]|uniref:uncharacterized protein n=1 Tax=Durotheca rogersii TaxID=419775 RepID=UPI0022200494|nr:uncharacterized protein GGS23DRAFT_565261 [Durotheca rogersii]KAI5863767.1 hypothetical protein GGS23DRAFT_565261 [Durotheca rogersii]